MDDANATVLAELARRKDWRWAERGYRRLLRESGFLGFVTTSDQASEQGMLLHSILH